MDARSFKEMCRTTIQYPQSRRITFNFPETYLTASCDQNLPRAVASVSGSFIVNLKTAALGEAGLLSVSPDPTNDLQIIFAGGGIYKASLKSAGGPLIVSTAEF